METMQKSLNAFLSTFPTKLRQTELFAKAGLLSALVLLLALYANTAHAQTQFVSNIVNANGASSDGNGNNSGMHFGRNFYTNNPGSTSNALPLDKGVVNGGGARYIATFNRNDNNTDTLRLNGSSTITAAGGQSVREVQLLYRVFSKDFINQPNQQGNFIPVALNYVSGDIGGTSKWAVTDNTFDLLQSASTPGTYIVQVFFQASISDPSSPTNPISFITDSNSGNYYSAQYYAFVNGQNIVTTTWTGTSSSDGNWFNPLNWTDDNGNHFVPSSTTDVDIPILRGSQNYPRIINGTTSYVNVANVRNLTLESNADGSVGARLELNDYANLRIFGSFQDQNYPASGFIQYGGLLTLAGTDQAFDANPTLRYFEITGGGTKRFTQSFTLVNSITFTPNSDGTPAGIVVLPIARGASNVITLARTATIERETEGAYIQAAVTTTRPVDQSGSDFGKIGVELSSLSNSPGTVSVTRTYSIYKSPNNNVSVRRGFAFTAADNPLASYTMKFSYLTAILNGIKPENLVFFQSKSGGAPFTALGRDGGVDQVNKTVTKSNITVDFLSTFTLGDITRPLPVTLTSFTATGTTLGASLKWVTASELNNKGFGVERQVAGSTTWQSIGFVEGTNAANGSSYSYLDTTIPAGATQVYYRLRQEDKTGELTYSPVATISRAAAGAALTLSPVPLDNSPLLVSFAEAGQAGAVIEVVNMQGQRVSRFATEGGSSEGVSLPLSHLAPGVYIVNVQVPGQATRHARFVKQ